MLGLVFTELLWADRPRSVNEVASIFGIRGRQHKKSLGEWATFEAVFRELSQNGWIHSDQIKSVHPRYHVCKDRIFEFYAIHPSYDILEGQAEYAVGRHTYPNWMPSDIDLRTNMLMTMLILGETSLAGDTLRRWSTARGKLYPRAVSRNLAKRLSVYIPPDIWNKRVPAEVKSDYLAELALSFNLELKVIPAFWRDELARAKGAWVASQWAYTKACDSLPNRPTSDQRKQSVKHKALSDFRDHFWSGRYREAYDAGCRVLVANHRLEEPQIRGLEGLDMMLCAIAVSAQAPHGLEQAQAWSSNLHVAAPVPIKLYDMVHRLVDCILHEKPMKPGEWVNPLHHSLDGVDMSSPRVALMVGLAFVWTRSDSTFDTKDRRQAINYLESILLKQRPCAGVKREIEGVIANLRGKKTDAPCLANAYQTRKPWERLLDRLQDAVTSQPTPSSDTMKADFAPHISWEIDSAQGKERSRITIEPRIITSARSKRGKPARLRNLSERYEDLFSDTDRRVMTHLRADSVGQYYSAPRLFTLDTLALLELVGHPHVQDSSGQPLRVERGAVELRVQQLNEGMRIQVVPERITSGSPIAWERPEAGRMVIFYRAPVLGAALDLLGKTDLIIPQEGANRLTPILEALAKHCRITTDGALMLGESHRDSDSTIYVSLRWSGSVLWLDPQVLPLGGTDLCCFPGHGDLQVTRSLNDTLVTATRDLNLETRNLDALLVACPRLRELSKSDFERGEICAIGKLEDALEVMTELVQADAQISWESQQRLSAPSAVDDSRFKIRLGKAKDWFQADVHYDADEDKVLGLRELIAARIGDSRFVRVDKDKIIALSQSMKRKLDRLASMGEATQGGVKCALSSLPVLNGIVRDFKHQELDKESSGQLKELHRALAYKPTPPKALNATLRPYQEDGYVWMSRLAKARLGACLADDMGLGKTVQTLALLCKRQNQGPALVVAPSSVVQNWLDETHRFAPKLKVKELSKLRHEFDPSAIGAKDVVVASYGIMTKEIALLEQVHFASLVFDEAHALKNWRTRRTQAASRIKSDFRLGLTGTPVENHVGEIWSLFQVLVPGLLGTKRAFEQRFSSPLASYLPDIRALKAFLEPFILRRTKSQVLRELPELNESVLKVVPNAKELAFYRALQEKALEAVAQAQACAKPEMRLKVLAEMTRLRQTAVDPRLVDDLLGPEGEKIALLVRKLLAIRKEGHRALVFTQFLGSLGLIKDALARAGVEFFELSGSTAPKARAKRIAAFQAGKRDVFLISLRAGGVGVNLSGADYVFHVDPWWNPAVEDQATARAHRMGQENPVQVYRLISSGTIEEKVLQLHERKRGLAEDLLTNLDKAKKLSLSQLREMLTMD